MLTVSSVNFGPTRTIREEEQVRLGEELLANVRWELLSPNNRGGRPRTCITGRLDGRNPRAGRRGEPQGISKQEDEEETPWMSILVAALLLYKIVGMVALMALSLVDSTTELVAKTSLSDKWTSASIDSFLAFFSVMDASARLSEIYQATTDSVKDRFDIVRSRAARSNIQLALLVLLFIVLLAWTLDKPLTMLLGPFEGRGFVL
ncbi:hypothetical protein FRB98_004376 [Tulasnella sp. 332]|nr:hypothetical protein FRB98_004376 [Tulasnella sp. 332]